MSSSAARFLLLGFIVLMLIGWSIQAGAVHVPPRALWDSLRGQGPDRSTTNIVLRLRAPRIALALLIGAGLGAAGAGYQGLFRNALADPFVIGASSGAALGATLAIARNWQGNLLGFDLVSLAALAGSLAVVAVVYGLATTGHGTPTLTLLLAGIAISSFVGAVVSLLMFLNSQQLSHIFGWLMGTLSGRSWPAARAAGPLVLLGITGLWLLARPLDCLSFGDETASSLGFDLRRVRGAVILAASIATAAAVAAGGIIGFVGLIAPHAARLLMGTARHALVIPASCLTGGALLLAADTVARTAVPNGELPVGVITALCGGPFFVYLLRRRASRWE